MEQPRSGPAEQPRSRPARGFRLGGFALVLGALALIGLAGHVAPAIARASDHGQFRLAYRPGADADQERWRTRLTARGTFDRLVESLNRDYILPADVRVNFDVCEEENAYYSPANRRITICYELIVGLEDLFWAEAANERELEAATIGATIHTFYHEVGHAFIDVYRLPITGREEDAVDPLATLATLGGGPAGETAALAGAHAFLLAAEAADADADLSFWGEHSLDEQRFYNVICWIYGSNPEKYTWLIDAEWLPEERADLCPEEYELMARGWQTLLAPHRR